MYERIHPTTQKGKAKKPKHSETELFTAPVPKPLAYLDVTAKQLQKSRVTVWKYITIYNNLMKGHHYEFIELKQCDHPILSRVEDLLALAQSDDIEVLTRLLCGLGFTPDDRKSKPCTLQEAQKRLEEHREKEARAKAQSPVQEQENAAQSKKAEYTERGTAPPQPEDMRNGSMKTSSESEEVSKPAVIPEKPAENDLAQAESQIDLQETIAQLAVMIDQYLTACNVFKMFDVRIRKQRNTKGRNRLLITIQE